MNSPLYFILEIIVIEFIQCLERRMVVYIVRIASLE